MKTSNEFPSYTEWDKEREQAIAKIKELVIKKTNQLGWNYNMNPRVYDQSRHTFFSGNKEEYSFWFYQVNGKETKSRGMSMNVDEMIKISNSLEKQEKFLDRVEQILTEE